MVALREHCEARLAGLKTVRQDYEDECRAIARFAMPARSRFLSAEKGPQQRRARNRSLLDEHGITSFRTLANGMTSGLSSPSRPWMKLASYEEGLSDDPDVKTWLADVERLILAFMAQTNFYSAAKTGYHELGLFGTEAAVMIEHPDVGMVAHCLTFGEYWIGVGTDMLPDSLYRRCPMSVRQAVQMFNGNVSSRVRQAYDRSAYEDVVDAYQAIEPDPAWVPGSPFSKRYRSVYWDAEDHKDTLLKVGGYHSKPFWAARWDTAGGDTYGYSPGMEALPSLRELQMQNKRENEVIDQVAKPEKVAPPNVKITGQPGNVVTASQADKDGFFIPYPVPHQAAETVAEKIARLYRKIDTTSFAEMFMAITNMAGIQPRNMEEIAARNEEKLTQLGPTIERVNNEKLAVAVDRVFDIMLRGEMLPPIPEALEGKPLKVEFISILTQMQRMVGLGQIERTVSFIGNIAGAQPEALDKLDVDELVDEYADRAGTPPRVIRSSKQVAEIRAARQQQQNAERSAAMMPAVQQGADAARLLSETDVNGRSMLDTMLGGA